MKALVFIIAVGFAAAIRPSAYQPNREYVYKLETQVLSGVPHHGIQHAGLKIKGVCKLQLDTNGQATLKLEDVSICKIQTELSSPYVETETVPDTVCTPVDSSLYGDMQQELTKPVKFNYQQGQVSGIQMDPQEPLWCANFKKGILSTFKVNLKGEHRQEDEVVGDWRLKTESLFSDDWQYNDDWQFNEQWKSDKGLFNDYRIKSNQMKYKLGFPLPAQYEIFFTQRNTDKVHAVMEADVCGVCKTVYGVMNAERGITADSSKLKVTKVKDFNNCALYPRHEQGLFSGLTLMPQKYSEKDLVEKSSQTDYEIIGTEDAFLIEKVKQLSTFTLTPMTPEHGSAVTTSIQKLTLIDSRSIGSPIVPPTSLRERVHGLLYEFSRDNFQRPSMFELDHLNMDIQYSTPQQKMDKIKELLQETVSLTHPKISTEATDKVRKIECLLKCMTSQDIITLCDSLLSAGGNIFTQDTQTRRKSEILLDILPTLTSPKVMKVMEHLITNNLISDLRAAISFKLMALTITPNVETVEALKPSGSLAQHVSSSRSRYLKNTIIISAGSIMRRFVKNAQNKGLPRYQAIALLESHFAPVGEVYRNVKSTRSDNEKIAKIKAMANGGAESFTPLLRDIAKSKSESNKVRKAAIFGFSRMPRFVKPKMENILMSIYMDRTEQPEIRMAAFTSLMDLKPSEAILQLIVRVQRKETSVQVGSFVYSYLSSLARADLPALQRLSFNLRKIMPQVRAILPDTFGVSKGWHFDKVSKHNDMGIGLDILKFSGSQEVVPSSVISRLSLHFFGKTIDAISGGVFASGMHPILNQLFGVHSGFLGSMSQMSMKNIINQYLTPLQSGSIDLGEMATDIQSIISKLGIVERPVLEKLDLGMYLKFLDNDIALLDITADDIMSWLQAGDVSVLTERVKTWVRQLSASQDQIDILKVLNTGVSSLQIPMPCGLPLFVNVSAVAIGHLKGHASMTGSRYMDIINYGISGNLPSEIIANSQIDASLAVKVSGKFGVRAGRLSTGVSLKVKAKKHLPVGIQGTWNRESGKLKLKFRLPTQETEILKAEMVPSTFVLKETIGGSCLDSTCTKEELTHPRHRQPVDIQFWVPLGINSYYNDVMQHGNKLSIHLQGQKTMPAYLPFEHIWCRKSIRMTLQPTGTPVPTVVELWLATSRWSDDWEERSKTFLPDYVTINSLITKPRVFKAGIAVGSEDDRKAEVSGVLVLSDDLWIQQLNTRVTVPSYFSQPISADLFLNMNAMSSWSSLRSRLSPNTPVAELSCICPSGSTFVISVRQQPGSPVSWDETLKNLYIRAIEQLSGESVQVTKVGSYPDSFDTTSYRVSIQGSNVNWHKVETISLSLLAASWASYGVPSISSFDARRSGAPVNHIDGYLTVSHRLRKGVLTLRTPSSMEYSMEIPTYVYKPWQKITSLERPIQWKYDMPDQEYVPSKYPWEYVQYGSCAVQYSEEIREQRVTTFDSQTYSFPSLPSSCEVVLAKDCSTLSLFTVLMQPIERSKILKVLIPRHRIVIKPESSWLSSTTYVKVEINGQEISLSDGVSVPLSAQVQISGTPISGIITKHGDWVSVRISSLGLIVNTDGRRVVVKTSYSMRSHMCGLCGNFNEDSVDDFEGPDMVVYPESKFMISRYVISNPTCSASAVRQQYNIPENYFQRTCQTQERTRVIQHAGKTCFSINPVQSCSSSCRSSEFTTISVPIHCRNAENLITQRMIEESRTMGIVPNMVSRRQDAVVSVDVPSTCVPSY